ncbi:MAG: cryptochrome/photolyase family protein [Parvularculaceae bacterium]
MSRDKAERLILVLGDQLSHGIASLRAGDKSSDVVVMGELRDEASYVDHHKKKLIFIFSAMRHFADELRSKDWRVDYARLDDDAPHASFTDLVGAAVERYGASEVVVVEAGEWRVRREIEGWPDRRDVDVTILDDNRFVCGLDEFNAWADGRKSLRMEYFYREMRRKTGLLMDGDEPVGGRWNYDAENRKPAGSDFSSPEPLKAAPDKTTRDVIKLVEEAFPDRFGDATPFWFAVTRKDARKALKSFVDERLAEFGDFQDAMLTDDKFLNHSLISLYVNAGLLDPLEACEAAAAAYDAGAAPLNAVEGFIRQIIGWREYVRGIYWREGADYVSRNYFGADRPLPDFYWTADTDMACVAAVVSQTREEAYAHHIQRLMVTGTFALIAGLDPHAVHEWYLSVYADAYEWVEAPNVVGMALYADGGVLASKPYAASGAYINRMSDYCKTCSYAVTKKTEDDACPFNALYWDFLVRHRDKLGENGRLSRVYQNWARMSDATKKAYRARAKDVLARLDAGERL